MNVAARQSRLPQLDFLRAVAVLLVIGNHSAICPPETNVYLNKITGVWYQGGWTGVDLFFVLSGFLISGLLFNEYKKCGNIDIKKFLLRRGFKIYPAFWFFIAVALLVTIINREEVWRGGFLSELLFVQNYHPGIWAHTWSLAVEEHFYIFLSLLFFVLLLTDKKNETFSFAFIPKLFGVIAITCLFFRIVAVINLPFRYDVNIEQTHFRIDSLFFGVFIAYLWNFRGLSESKFLEKNKFFFGLAGILCFVPAFVFKLEESFWLETFGLTILYVGSGFLLLALLKTENWKSRIFRFLAEIGKYSYSIYLWNLPTHFWLTKFTNLADENWFLYAFLYWTTTFVLGIGTAKLVEYPVLRVRDKIIPSAVSALKTA